MRTELHSALLFAYYALVLAVTMLVLHPAYILLSALGAGAYLVSIAGWGALGRRLRWVLPLVLIAVAFNLAFNHRGATALWYLHNGNAVTLESLVFGLCAGGMLAAAVLWFSSFHLVFTSEKLMALSGRFAPALSLLFAMTLRFVPRLTRQMKRIWTAQAAMDGQTGFFASMRRAAATVSIAATWALEGAVTTADSMRVRGSGLTGRTHFHRERWTRRETVLLLALCVLAALVFAGAAAGSAMETFYPTLDFARPTPRNLLSWCGFGLLCFAPWILNGREALRWRRCRSNI